MTHHILEEEHVRKFWDSNTHAGTGAVLPVVRDSSTLDALDVELAERAGNRVETVSEDDDVDVDVAKLSRYASCVYRLNWILVDINNVDVVLADNLVEVLLERRSLSAPWVRWLLGCKQSSLLWMGNAF